MRKRILAIVAAIGAVAAMGAFAPMAASAAPATFKFSCNGAFVALQNDVGISWFNTGNGFLQLRAIGGNPTNFCDNGLPGPLEQANTDNCLTYDGGTDNVKETTCNDWATRPSKQWKIFDNGAITNGYTGINGPDCLEGDAILTNVFMNTCDNQNLNQLWALR